MVCPFCGNDKDKVIDSRAADAGRVIRRRRQCLNCVKRFTTYERVEQTARLTVVKRDRTRAAFDESKVLRSIQLACGKRPISEERKRALVDEVSESLHRDFDREVESSEIGQRVMAGLRGLDEVAYVRYASEYRKFESAKEFIEEAHELHTRPRDVKDQQGLWP
ncbi:MAG: transcriptional repressor NrdR [Phycisphaerales bacterium]|nr:transcriptional repressor NrdR [Phycisphaerales bacterium]